MTEDSFSMGRYDRIEELTGLNPRRFKDLQALLVAIAVDDA
jgi:sugar diacid utilization regulator